MGMYCCPSHLPRLLALPNQSERTTQKPTPLCIIPQEYTLYNIRCTVMRVYIHTHEHLLLPCSLTDLNLCEKFRQVKNKALANA